MHWVNKMKGLLNRFGRPGEKEALAKILRENQGRSVIISCPSIDWNHYLFQRPQQMGRNLAEQGHLFFFCTENAGYDHVQGYDRMAPGLYLTNRFHWLVRKMGPHILYILSTNLKIDWDFVKREMEKGNVILYEYIDEIDPTISGVEIPRTVFERHDNILRDERCIVIATADKLFHEVLEHRTGNCALVTNGVDFDHFSNATRSKALPDAYAKMIDSGRPVIGYYGALASWMDYDLINALAEARPNYHIVLFGLDYDKTVNVLRSSGSKNIHVLGPVPYQDLPGYAGAFTVSIIPFLLNDITRSTSPSNCSSTWPSVIPSSPPIFLNVANTAPSS